MLDWFFYKIITDTTQYPELNRRLPQFQYQIRRRTFWNSLQEQWARNICHVSQARLNTNTIPKMLAVLGCWAGVMGNYWRFATICWPLNLWRIGCSFGTQVRGFKPGRSRRIFKGEKIFSTPSFGGEVKPPVPCRRFAACKRSLELRGSRILRRNLSEHFSPTKSSTFRC